MNFMPIGSMRRRVRLEAEVDIDDGAGGFNRDYRPLGYLRARVNAISANQQFSEQRFEQTTSYQVDIRWRADIAAGMRFIFRDHVLFIHAIRDPDGERRFLTCACEEIA